MLQMTAIELEAFLNALYKVVDNTYVFILADGLNLRRDDCLQSWDGLRIVLIDVVSEDTPRGKSLGDWDLVNVGTIVSVLWLMGCSPKCPLSQLMVMVAV